MSTMKNTGRKGDIESFVDHRLSSTRPGESEPEQIAERIERQRAERVPITFETRKRFLHDCRKISQARGYDTAKVSLDDLKEYRDKVAEEVKNLGCRWIAPKCFAIHDDTHCLLALLDRAVGITSTSYDDTWLHYKDFSFFHSKLESRWPWLRTEMRTALLITFLYFFFTPILFCNIMDDAGVCESDGDNYLGWVSSLYFASTTISTVGYGDLSVQQDPRWRSFIGSMYMIVSVVIAAVAFSASAGVAVSPFENFISRVCDYLFGKEVKGEFLYKKVRRVKFKKLGEITIQFFSLNLLGVFAARIAIAFEDGSDPETDWTWMTSFYWALQTTTTIGYGDLAQPFGLRWFKIFYLILSTYSVGNCLGKLSALKTELSQLSRYYAWQRRKVTKRYIEETQAYNQDENLDQFEFLVGSMIMLGKITSDDIKPVMDRYRELAGGKGFISLEHDAEHDHVGDSTDEDSVEDLTEQE